MATAALQVGFPGPEVDLIELAVDEASSNAVLYASEESPPTIEVEIHIGPESFTVILEDGNPNYSFENRGIELDAQLESDARGGLGIYIMKRFMDEVRYECCPERGSRIIMSKRLPSLQASP
ncbi:MAG: ATP-binding protein [Planctomycetes bacterium]|nr:ATP-binding protein [Planctomycetota bacterium]